MNFKLANVAMVIELAKRFEIVHKFTNNLKNYFLLGSDGCMPVFTRMANHE